MIIQPQALAVFEICRTRLLIVSDGGVLHADKRSHAAPYEEQYCRADEHFEPHVLSSLTLQSLLGSWTMRRSRPPCLPAFFRKAGGWREMFGFAGLSLRRYARTSSVAAISPDIFEEIPNAQPAPNCKLSWGIKLILTPTIGISATDMLSILASRRSFAPPKILFPHPAAPASKQQRKGMCCPGWIIAV